MVFTGGVAKWHIYFTANLGFHRTPVVLLFQIFKLHSVFCASQNLTRMILWLFCTDFSIFQKIFLDIFVKRASKLQPTERAFPIAAAD